MRSNIAALAVVALLAAGCRTASSQPAGPLDHCVIVGGPGTPAEVSVYESAPFGTPGGRRLYIGPLNPHERKRIDTPTGKIWYSYRWHDGDTWKDGSDRPCRGGETVPLP